MKGWPGEPDMEYDTMMAQGEAAANAGKPITDVIFDFGNVLLYWDPAAVLIPRYSAATIEQFGFLRRQRPYGCRCHATGGHCLDAPDPWR